MKYKMVYSFLIIGAFMPLTLSAESEISNNNNQQKQQEQLQQSQQQQPQQEPKTTASPHYTGSYKNSIQLSNSDDHFKPFTPTYSTQLFSQPSVAQIKEPSSLRLRSPISLQTNHITPLSYPAQSPTPVIMQYLAQGQMPGGIQYLQLIPTRPLIVPISPYITQLQQHSSIPDLGGKNSLTASTNEQTSAINSLPSYTYYSSGNPMTAGSMIGAYSSPTPVYKFFRQNNGLEIINGPHDLTLNTNEYMPQSAITNNENRNLNRIQRG